MSFFSKLMTFFKEGAMRDTEISSKRIIMYTFTVVVIGMIAIEALFNLLLMIEWGLEGGDEEVEFQMVFSTLIYSYVFGIITALAGINVIPTGSNKPKDKKPTEEPTEEI